MTGEVGTWDKQYAGSALDLTNYVTTFDDEFNNPSITPNAKIGGPWFAPVHAPFGAAKFASPTDVASPFSYADGHLTISMKQVAGNWQSGLMQTVNNNGVGFAQQYGYFEMRAKFPGGAGTWPAFWLLSDDPTKPRVEIDIVEAYGGDTRGHHAAVHVTPLSDDTTTSKVALSSYTKEAGMFDGDFHTYGAMISKDTVTIYFDRVEVEQIHVTGVTAQPFYMLVDLALNKDEANQASGQYDMTLDYVRAYAAAPTPVPAQTAAPTQTLAATAEPLDGGTGNDVLSVADQSGHHEMHGLDGDDSITGGAGDDLINGNRGNDSVDGGAGGPDTLMGGQGDDMVVAHAGACVLNGNLGADTVIGGAGADTVHGGQGDDSIAGGDGADHLFGDLGNDTISSGAGADIVHFAAGGGHDVVLDFNAAAGDRIEIDGGAQYSVVQQGSDTVVTVSTGDTLTLKGVLASSLSSGWIFHP